MEDVQNVMEEASDRMADMAELGDALSQSLGPTFDEDELLEELEGLEVSNDRIKIRSEIGDDRISTPLTPSKSTYIHPTYPIFSSKIRYQEDGCHIDFGRPTAPRGSRNVNHVIKDDIGSFIFRVYVSSDYTTSQIILLFFPLHGEFGFEIVKLYALFRGRDDPFPIETQGALGYFR